MASASTTSVQPSSLPEELLKIRPSLSTLDSFKEYVLLDQDKCQVQVFYREEPDLWRKSSFNDLDAAIELKSIGCMVALKDIYEDVLEG